MISEAEPVVNHECCREWSKKKRQPNSQNKKHPTPKKPKTEQNSNNNSESLSHQSMPLRLVKYNLNDLNVGQEVRNRNILELLEHYNLHSVMKNTLAIH